MTTIRITDNSNVDEILREIRKLKRKEIRVGVHGQGETSMIANVHEYGTKITVTPKMRGWFASQGYPLKKSTTEITIPERSFIRSGFDENVDDVFDKAKELFESVLELNLNANLFMDMVGLEMVGKIQDKIQTLNNPANSQMTKDRKGSSNPLIDSGRLFGAIDRRVE